MWQAMTNDEIDGSGSDTPHTGGNMENQHREIKGYRELNADEIALMNVVKTTGAELGELVDTLKGTGGLDQRWINIGATHLQEGLMALTRGIAKPTFF
jgi:hypothetical protein